MARQARAEVTRQKILDAAVDLFSEVGYASTGLGEIIERAEITKGALYYHFDSREALAAAIIEDATDRVIGVFREIAQSSSPAMENMIHGSFVVLGMIADDKPARIGRQLARALGQFSVAGADTYVNWTTVMSAQSRRASAEGDLLPGLDADVVGETIIATLLGIEQLSTAISHGKDMIARLTHSWELLLPGIVNEASLQYFQQFLAREAMRYDQTCLTFD